MSADDFEEWWANPSKYPLDWAKPEGFWRRFMVDTDKEFAREVWKAARTSGESASRKRFLLEHIAVTARAALGGGPPEFVGVAVKELKRALDELAELNVSRGGSRD